MSTARTIGESPDAILARGWLEAFEKILGLTGVPMPEPGDEPLQPLSEAVPA